MGSNRQPQVTTSFFSLAAVADQLGAIYIREDLQEHGHRKCLINRSRHKNS